MQVRTSVTEHIMTVIVEGEINTITAPQLAQTVEDLRDVTMLIFDLQATRYVSSAGLRLFLSCQRTMTEAGGDMLIRNYNEFVMETLVSVGYDRIMKIEGEGGAK